MQSALARGEQINKEVEIDDGRVMSLVTNPMPDGGWVATHEDVTERRRAEAKIHFMARHDALTKLPNRAAFREETVKALANLQSGESLGIMCLDLDRFKQVNDTLGHPTGDQLLQAVAEDSGTVFAKAISCLASGATNSPSCNAIRRSPTGQRRWRRA